MPSTNTRHFAISALCAALLLGTAAAPALAAPPDTGRAAARSQAPALTGLGTAMSPVTHLLDSTLYADDDPLTEAEAKELADAIVKAQKEIDAALKEAEQAGKGALAEAQKEIDEALKEVKADLKEVEADVKEALAEAAAAETTTGTQAAETTQAASQTTNFTGDALGTLGKTLGALLGALTSIGSEEEVDTTADEVLKSLVHVSAATRLDRGLPAA
ncbi:hypothetical protein [Streptomyces chartreusis]|uniref:hypothetical protein n=1 Tax=Streptomyces chartreusis TaxID=1969 RepID=UPI00364090E9